MTDHDAPVDDGLTGFLHASMPFAAQLGVQALRGGPDEVVARVDWDAGRTTTGGALHGGYLMGVVDTIGGACAFYNLPEGAGTATIESKTNFFRAAGEGRYVVRATPVHVGRRTIVVQTDVVNTDGKLVTRTTQTQAVLIA